MPVPLPTATTRWRCALCGNLTRFDVTRSTRVVEYVHLDLGGEPRVEETDVLSESVESVRCRWCNALDRIELVDRPGSGDVPRESDGEDGTDGADACADSASDAPDNVSDSGSDRVKRGSAQD